MSDPTQESKAAVNRRYPTGHDNGAGFATLGMTIPQTGDTETWRPYRINTPAPGL